jgi:hypothetical protein
MRKKRIVNTANNTWSVDFVNRSHVSDIDLELGVMALQRQINNHFLPAWSIGAQLNIVSVPSKENATIFILDDSRIPGIGGFHDITATTEIPVGFIFAQTVEDAGDSWTYAASHELMEMLVDPYANLAAEGQFNGSPAFFAYEVCDPVEADGGYKIAGTQVSNFVFPSWFINTTSTQYDYLNLLDAPFTIGTNGTLSMFKEIGKWHDVTNNGNLPKIHPKHTRRFRRHKRTNPNYGLTENHPEYMFQPHQKD